MSVVLAVCVLYFACVVLYQAGKKRTEMSFVKSSSLLQFVMKVVGVGLIMTALIILAPLQGMERGIVVWLALLSSTAFICLLLGAYKAPYQLGSAGLAAFVGVAAFIVGVVS